MDVGPMTAPTASADLVAKLVLNPLKNAKDRLIFGGKTLNGVMHTYEQLGDKEGAESMASCIYQLADSVQILNALIQKLEAEAS